MAKLRGGDAAGKYGGRNWNEVERNARQQWESQDPNTPWEEIKAAVREGFERARR